MPSENGTFGNVYTDRAQYDAAMAEWQAKKAKGDPFPGPMPRLDMPGQIEDKINQINFPTEIRNSGMWQGMAQAGADAAPRANPYSAAIADQSRPAQLALIDQMRGQMNGPSIAAMQGQRAMGQMNQQALMQGGRAGMLGAQMGAGGLAGDVGQARLGEVMRAQAGMGGAAGNLRGADLRSADAQSQAALQQRQQDDLMRRFYASQGSALAEATGRTSLEAEKLRQRLALQGKKNDQNMMQTGAGLLSSVLGGYLK